MLGVIDSTVAECRPQEHGSQLGLQQRSKRPGGGRVVETCKDKCQPESLSVMAGGGFVAELVARI